MTASKSHNQLSKNPLNEHLSATSKDDANVYNRGDFLNEIDSTKHELDFKKVMKLQTLSNNIMYSR